MTLSHFLKVWNALKGHLKGKLELILDVRRANRSSEGHLGAQIGSDSAASADRTKQNGGQEASKRPGWAAQTGVQSPRWRYMAQLGGFVQIVGRAPPPTPGPLVRTLG